MIRTIFHQHEEKPDPTGPASPFMNRVVVRKTDGAFFEPSYKNHGDAMASLLSDEPDLYFRRIRWTPRRWWQLSGHWHRTGEIWEPKEFKTFDVITPKRAREIVLLDQPAKSGE